LLAPSCRRLCRASRQAATLAELRNVSPDVQEVKVEQGLDQAMEGYRRFLEETPETAMTPEAMRRLADLQIEKQFGIHRRQAAGNGAGARSGIAGAQADTPNPAAAVLAPPRGIDEDFGSARPRRRDSGSSNAGLAGGRGARRGPLRSRRSHSMTGYSGTRVTRQRQVLYQKARASTSSAAPRPWKPWSA
jgi:hypothetical protein